MADVAHARGVDLARMTARQTELFWKKVDRLSAPDGCWTWTGCLHQKGYGRLSISYDGRCWQALAHRVSMYLATGTPPQSDMLVCHRCDNPRCVRPDHLFLGTVQDNADDMWAKGRNRSTAGEQNGRSVLTEEKVRTIRMLRGQGEAPRKIAEALGVSLRCVQGVIYGHSWKSAA